MSKNLFLLNLPPVDIGKVAQLKPFPLLEREVVILSSGASITLFHGATSSWMDRALTVGNFFSARANFSLLHGFSLTVTGHANGGLLWLRGQPTFPRTSFYIVISYMTTLLHRPQLPT